MGEIVNLRRMRKRKARDAARQAGDENAARHGRARDDRARETLEREREARRHAGHCREEAEGDGEADD